jgi:glycosyltransferase involved in cell wall biosynthesis
VVVPCHDVARFLPATFASIRANAADDVEWVLVDDGSADDTGERMRAHAVGRACARVVRTSGLGLAGALAVAATLARGELLARADADDTSDPQRLDRQAAWLAAHPDVGVLGSAAHVIDDAGRITGRYVVPLDDGAVARTLRRGPPFVHGSVMMRRAAYEAAGGYRAPFRASQDYDLWLRMAPHARFANLPEPLYAWRRHPGGVFARAREAQIAYAAIARAFDEQRRETGGDAIAALAAAPDVERFVADSPRRARLAQLIGEGCVRDGRVAAGRRWLARAARWGAGPGAYGWWAASLAVAVTPRAKREARA